MYKMSCRSVFMEALFAIAKQTKTWIHCKYAGDGWTGRGLHTVKCYSGPEKEELQATRDSRKCHAEGMKPAQRAQAVSPLRVQGQASLGNLSLRNQCH